MPDRRLIATAWGKLAFEPADPRADLKEVPRAAERGAERADSASAAPTRTASGRPRADRAAQFAPFAALQGYYDLIRNRERIAEPRHELTEDEAAALSQTVSDLQPGDMVCVTYYEDDAYLRRTGCVAGIDFERRRLQLVKTLIDLDDIRDIEIASNERA